jgi:hypothetical protein
VLNNFRRCICNIRWTIQYSEKWTCHAHWNIQGLKQYRTQNCCMVSSGWFPSVWIHMPRNYPEESTQHSKHGGSLKSTHKIYLLICCWLYNEGFHSTGFVYPMISEKWIRGHMEGNSCSHTEVLSWSSLRTSSFWDKI